mgnify:CR=1 FL=1
MHTTDLPLSTDYTPAAVDCTCHDPAGRPSPLRCDRCVAALVLDEIDHGEQETGVVHAGSGGHHGCGVGAQRAGPAVEQ